ncbi:hypothetical protein GCM10011504_10310 [Siccirubricoccus deserti]|nr:hypothetical protein GCM10011504_10310 [Siccirubricoccus deserti]
MGLLHQPDHAADGDVTALGTLDGAELGGGESEAAGHGGILRWGGKASHPAGQGASGRGEAPGRAPAV